MHQFTVLLEQVQLRRAETQLAGPPPATTGRPAAAVLRVAAGGGNHPPGPADQPAGAAVLPRPEAPGTAAALGAAGGNTQPTQQLARGVLFGSCLGRCNGLSSVSSSRSSSNSPNRSVRAQIEAAPAEGTAALRQAPRLMQPGREAGNDEATAEDTARHPNAVNDDAAALVAAGSRLPPIALGRMLPPLIRPNQASPVAEAMSHASSRASRTAWGPSEDEPSTSAAAGSLASPHALPAAAEAGTPGATAGEIATAAPLDSPPAMAAGSSPGGIAGQPAVAAQGSTAFLHLAAAAGVGVPQREIEAEPAVGSSDGQPADAGGVSPGRSASSASSRPAGLQELELGDSRWQDAVDVLKQVKEDIKNCMATYYNTDNAAPGATITDDLRCVRSPYLYAF